MQNFSVKGEGNWQEAKIEGRKKGRSITDTIIDGWTKKGHILRCAQDNPMIKNENWHHVQNIAE